MDGKDENRFILLTQNILGDQSLTPCDKLVLARITGFTTFYESNATTAEFLGIGEDTVKKSKQKLEKLGYILLVADNGHGKKYAPNYNQILGSGGESTRLPMKIYPAGDENLPAENKEKNKEKNKKGDESVADGVENSKKQEYGREDINDLVELWQAETGIDIKGQQNQRRQLYNLIRKYGSDGTKALVRRVGDAIRSGDRFAPQIATPSDLTGKYSKLAKLDMWEARRQNERPLGQGSAPQDDRPIPEYLRGGIPDYNGAFIPVSDEEHARVSQMFKEARKTLPFLKNREAK